jgi:hypothetical protein
MTVKTRIAIVLLWILCAGFETAARAVCVGASVNSFGARGDGHTDDMAAIQSAINAASSAGGGSVVFGVARYFTTGTLVLPQGVVLCGAIEGPFDYGRTDAIDHQHWRPFHNPARSRGRRPAALPFPRYIRT